MNVEAPLLDHGVGVAWGLCPSWSVCGAGLQKALILWTTLPVLRSTQRTKRCDPSLRAVVKQIWSPETTGEDLPPSWIAVFQRTFFALPNSAVSLA